MGIVDLLPEGYIVSGDSVVAPIDRHLLLSCSAGNDSVAMIQTMHEHGANNVDVLYIDTGWAAESWGVRKQVVKNLVESYGFRWHE